MATALTDSLAGLPRNTGPRELYSRFKVGHPATHHLFLFHVSVHEALWLAGRARLG
jgi:hypothetical protein